MNELIPLDHRSTLQMADVPPQEYEASGPSLPVRRLLLFLLKYWWIPMVTLVTGGVAGVAYVHWMPPTFISKASMWETAKIRLPEGGLFTESTEDFLGTQTELLQSGTLRDMALARLRAAGTNAIVPLGDDGQPQPVIITVSGNAKSSVFRIEANGANAAYTQSYLNKLMEVYLEYKRNVRQEVSGGTLASITEQVQLTEQQLKDQQDILMAFQRTNNIVLINQEGTVAGNYLATLETKLSDLRLEERLLKATISDANSTNSILGPMNPETIADSGSAQGTPTGEQAEIHELELLKIQQAQLSKSLRPKHPKLVALDTQIQQAEKMLENYHRQSQSQLAEFLQDTQSKMTNLQVALKEWQAKVVDANTLIGEAERLKVNVQRVQSVYDRLMLLLQNVGISRNIDQENLAVLQPASPAIRSYAKEIRLLTASFACSLGLGLAIVFLMGIRDDRFTSLLELHEKVGETVVGQVPQVRDFQANNAVPIPEKDECYAYAESFRSLRSALFFMAPKAERPHVVLITSALPHEGKSTIAFNLARTLALGGSEVVLVDADLRKGALHKLLGLRAEPGLAEVLRQSGEFDKLIQTNSHPNLYFIPRGCAADNSGDLFLSPLFDQLIARLRERFEYVLIDCSPVFATDDASTIAPKVDGTLFVVRSRFSSPKPVREALSLLYQRRARVLGMIFNQADSTDSSYYYYKNAEYYSSAKSS